MGEGHFERLDAAECKQLLRTTGVGRVAFNGPDGLTVLPLAFSVDGEQLVLRTAAGTQLANLPEDSEVAFEVDEFDAEVLNGWSVLVRGTLTKLTPGELDGEVAPPTPYVPGVRRVLLGLSLEQLSGRAASSD